MKWLVSTIRAFLFVTPPTHPVPPPTVLTMPEKGVLELLAARQITRAARLEEGSEPSVYNGQSLKHAGMALTYLAAIEAGKDQQK